jgi:hypothetical protein
MQTGESMKEAIRRRSFFPIVGCVLAAGLGLLAWLVVAPASGTTGATPAGSAEYPPIDCFDRVHTPVGGDGDAFLIFGKLRKPVPEKGLPPSLAALLGRWEGFDFGPPVRKDWKYAMFISRISDQGGTAYFWGGTSLQFPSCVRELDFHVLSADAPAIQLRYDDGGGMTNLKLTYDRKTNTLRGWRKTRFDVEYGGAITDPPPVIRRTVLPSPAPKVGRAYRLRRIPSLSEDLPDRPASAS